ncbi:MAG TPA: hypothetical protein VGL20_04360 [Candidatus Dormibacteraeota bacterium]
MTETVDALAEGVADRLWHRIQARDRLDALDETATGPTHRDRLVANGDDLAAAVEEMLTGVLGAVADGRRRTALRALRSGALDQPTPEIEVLLGAGLAVAAWGGDGVSVSEAGRAAGELCDRLTARVTELVGRRLRGDG